MNTNEYDGLNRRFLIELLIKWVVNDKTSSTASDIVRDVRLTCTRLAGDDSPKWDELLRIADVFDHYDNLRMLALLIRDAYLDVVHV
jgi:hypothetical protein